jgi:hypothetical protein
MPDGRPCGESHQRASDGADRAKHDGTRYGTERSIGATIPRMSGKRQQGHGQDCENAEGLHRFLQQGGGRIRRQKRESPCPDNRVIVMVARQLWS